MNRRKLPVTGSLLDMITSIDRRLTELTDSDMPKRLHCIKEKLDSFNPKLLTIEHVDRFYSEIKTVLTAHEACEYMGITESHLYKLTSTGRIPYYKPTGKLVYFDRSELDDWLLRNRIYNNNTKETDGTESDNAQAV